MKANSEAPRASTSAKTVKQIKAGNKLIKPRTSNEAINKLTHKQAVQEAMRKTG